MTPEQIITEKILPDLAAKTEVALINQKLNGFKLNYFYKDNKTILELSDVIDGVVIFRSKCITLIKCIDKFYKWDESMK